MHEDCSDGEKVLMRIASIQLDVSDKETREARVARTFEMVHGCRGADLIILPETWATGYFAFERYDREAEPEDGELAKEAGRTARELRAYLHLGSFIERTTAGELANTSLLFDPSGSVIAAYRKMHLWGLGSEESRILKAGKTVVTCRTEFGILGLATCYDLRFPEPFRCMIDQGATIFLICSAWPYPRLEHWLMLNRVRAFENEAFLISANCVGNAHGRQFAGHSHIVDPWGTVVSSAGDEEAVIWADVDPKMPERVRKLFPPLRDRVFRCSPM